MDAQVYRQIEVNQTRKNGAAALFAAVRLRYVECGLNVPA
jgi:hypothetical protein